MYRGLIFAVQKYTNSAREVEESVMGRIAWEAFNDIKYKDMDPASQHDEKHPRNTRQHATTGWRFHDLVEIGN